MKLPRLLLVLCFVSTATIFCPFWLFLIVYAAGGVFGGMLILGGLQSSKTPPETGMRSR